MMYLLDTNILSETRRLRPHGAVLAWLGSHPSSSLHVSAFTAGEIQQGIELTREQNPARASELQDWLDQMVVSYNFLPMDARTFRIWARLTHRMSQTLYSDAMIAATAIAHGLTIATRNTRDFNIFDIPTTNPFEYRDATG